MVLLVSILIIKRATFAKACFGHPSPCKRQKTRSNNALGATIRPAFVHCFTHHCKLDANFVTLPQMTRGSFGCNYRSSLALRLPWWGLPALAIAFHGLQAADCEQMSFNCSKYLNKPYHRLEYDCLTNL